MKKINMKQFLEIVENSEGRIEVCERGETKDFTVKVCHPNKSTFCLDIPKQENGYDFIYKELLRHFDGRCKELCLFQGSLHWVTLMIGDAWVALKYSRPEGQKYLFGV